MKKLKLRAIYIRIAQYLANFTIITLQTFDVNCNFIKSITSIANGFTYFFLYKLLYTKRERYDFIVLQG